MGALLAALSLWPCASRAQGAAVQLEELSWTELRARIAGGATTVLVPLGGTEQSGPHLALGKHNVRVRLLATRIAQELGNAIVAPVLAYVPEGDIEPPTQHMRWPGTISIPSTVFEATLVAAARSFRKHGFCHVVLLGDHGGYRASLDRVATRLNREWAPHSGCRAHALPEYYRAASTDFAQMLRSRGFSDAEIGSHAGLADTSLALAVDAAMVRRDAAPAAPGRRQADDGVSGDPSRASAELGRLGLAHIVTTSVAAIRAATAP